MCLCLGELDDHLGMFLLFIIRFVYNFCGYYLRYLHFLLIFKILDFLWIFITRL